MSERVAFEVQDLTVGYSRPDGRVVNTVVWNVDFSLQRGRVLGLVGESGCGKSTAALASIGYRSPSMRILGGKAVLEGTDLLGLPINELRHYWGRRVAYVPQGASTALNPALTVGVHLTEPLAHHLGLSGSKLLHRQIELLEQVGIPSPASALRRFPHQFSGGQQQRITLALALACNPIVLVLDEPTTGIDVTTQAKISKLLKQLIAQFEIAALFVSHDLALVGSVADRVAAMYGGQIVEEGPARVVARHPAHPYVRALASALPDARVPRALTGIPGRPPLSVVKTECPFAARCSYVVDDCLSENPELVPIGDEHQARCIRVREIESIPLAIVPIKLTDVFATQPLLAVNGLWCSYHARGRDEAVVKDVSMEILPRETVGIVGESGSGKSTLIRAIAGLHRPLEGKVRFGGVELAPLAVMRPKNTRRDLQIVFQNPDTSLNPRQTVMQIVSRPIQMFRRDITRSGVRDEVFRLLEAVKLPAALAYRYPSALSGGQKQRVALARAFAARPTLLLCDEVTSALDVSVQATVLGLIAELSEAFGTAVAFVSHDLAVVRTIAHRALVMERGEVREAGLTEELFSHPRHPYTQELLRSIPSLLGSAVGDGPSSLST